MIRYGYVLFEILLGFYLLPKDAKSLKIYLDYSLLKDAYLIASMPCLPFPIFTKSLSLSLSLECRIINGIQQKMVK